MLVKYETLSEPSVFALYLKSEKILIINIAAKNCANLIVII